MAMTTARQAQAAATGPHHRTNRASISVSCPMNRHSRPADAAASLIDPYTLRVRDEVSGHGELDFSSSDNSRGTPQTSRRPGHGGPGNARLRLTDQERPDAGRAHGDRVLPAAAQLLDPVGD